MRPPWMLIASLVLCLLGVCHPSSAQEVEPPLEPVLPYPRSEVIAGLSFSWFTHKRLAPGSDNWPITWAADDHQYAVWGDGGGFGGSNDLGRDFIGVARIEGTASTYVGRNVWGGYKPEVKPKPRVVAKSYGIIAIGNTLYMWQCKMAKAVPHTASRLYRSTNRGRKWVAAKWEFPVELTFYCPTFLQFGKGNAGARDSYVYMYAAERNDFTWVTHAPGRIMLMRAPQSQLMDRAAYEFFAGRTEAGDPVWTTDVSARQPVAEDANGLRLVSAAYNPGLDRYLIGYAHTERGASHMALLDGPTPWGPWTTAAYEHGWGQGSFTGTCCLLWYFAPKWWTPDGRGFTIVFSGGLEADSWNTVEGIFNLATGPSPPQRASSPLRLSRREKR